MKIGISITSNYPGAQGREGARAMVDRVIAAHAADLDSLFVGDHHVTPTPYYQNTAILGRLLAHWGNKPAGALFLLPLWHPVLLAEQVATLACIAQGPFILQCGLGNGRQQFAGMGEQLAERVPRFEASVDILRRLWAGETVTHDGPWPIENAQISPLPPEPISIWVGSLAPKAIHRTARLAEGWLASPSLDLGQAQEALARYRQSCAEFVRQPEATAIRRDIYVGTDPAEARRVVEPYLQNGYRGFAEDALMVGSIEEVTEEIRGFEQAGYTDIIVRNIVLEQEQALGCIERLGEVRAGLATN